MHFAYDEDQVLLRETTRRFLQHRHPIGAVRERLDERDTLDRDVWRGGAELGWTAMLVPEALDGGSVTRQPIVDLVAVAEELGRELYPGPVLATNVVAHVIARHGDDEQRARHLPAIANGDLVATWSTTDDGTPDGAVAVAATTDDDALVLDGSAGFVHDAHVADLLLVTVALPAGIALALVPGTADGLTTRVLHGLDVTRRLCEVHFAGVRIGAGAIVADATIGAAAVEEARRLATVVQAAEVVGAGEAVFERTVEYLKERVQFGRAIGSFQAIKHRLADLLVELEAARAAARYAALAVADDREDRDEAVAVAGSYVRDAMAHLCGESVQLHGGIGFTWEHDAHLYLRRVKSEQACYGASWWHRERLCSLAERAAQAG